MKNICLFISLIFLTLACSPKKKTEAPTITQPIPVSVISLQQTSLSPTIQASGVFTTEDETYLGFKIGGVVQHVFVKEGDAVKSGQLLASLNLTEIKAQVQQAQILLDKAQRDFNRAKNLYRDSVATLEQFQNAKTGLEIAQQAYNAGAFNQSYAEIRASQAGFILKKLANDGQIVGPGTPVLLLNGANKGNWVLKVGLSDRDWAVTAVGDPAEIRLDVAANESFMASVLAKSEGVDPVTGTLWVTLGLQHAPKAKLAAGLFGKAILKPRKKISAWVIPYDAILDGNATEAYVFVTKDGKKAEKIKVQISNIEHGKVLVSGGLENIQYLITTGNAYLDGGSTIQIIR
jgi:RND family efflux transporter MFP subunit